MGVGVGRGGLGPVSRRTGVNLPVHPLVKALFLEGPSPRCPASQLHAPTRDGEARGELCVHVCGGGIDAKGEVAGVYVYGVQVGTLDSRSKCSLPVPVSCFEARRIVPCHRPPFGLRKHTV